MSSFFARVTMLVGVGLTLSMWPSSARTAATDSIGLITTLQGKAYVAREGGAKPLLLNGQDEVLIHDVIETQSQSRLKILFYDDSLLTIAENSRIAVREFTHGSRTPSKLIIQLDRGAIRNSIGGHRAGAESKFQVQTPAGLIGAGDAYFTVWIDEGIPALIQDDGEHAGSARGNPSAGPLGPPTVSHRQVGVANIGQAGSVTLTSGAHTTIVNPGQYVLVAPNSGSVMPTTWTATPPRPVATVIAATELKALPKTETPKETLRVIGGGVDPAIVTGMSNLEPAAMVPPVGQIRVPQVIMTPPAVISGAAPISPSGTSAAQPGPPAPPAPHPVPPPTPPPTPPPVPPPTPPPTPPPVPPPTPPPTPPPAPPPAPPPTPPPVPPPTPPPTPPPMPPPTALPAPLPVPLPPPPAPAPPPTSPPGRR